MDLNVQPPAQWRIDGGPYEIADFCLANKANVLVLLNAWLDSGEEPEDPKDWRTMNYWVARLRPLWTRTDDLEEEEEDSDAEQNDGGQYDAAPQGHETVVIVCNRCGHENGTDDLFFFAHLSLKQRRRQA